MKNIHPIIVILIFALFALPNQTNAAWWSPSSWFSKNQQATSTDTTSVVSPLDDPQISNEKTIEKLKVEMATLKSSLDNLYAAHNRLVEDHNALLKYVNAIPLSKNVGATTNNSSLETKVTNLGKKLDDVCSHIFSNLGGIGTKCPSSQFNITGTLESRIKKLEGGF